MDGLFWLEGLASLAPLRVLECWELKPIDWPVCNSYRLRFWLISYRLTVSLSQRADRSEAAQMFCQGFETVQVVDR